MLKKCPWDKILVVLDKKGNVVKSLHGGTVFVPFFRRCEFIDLTPFQVVWNQRSFSVRDGIKLTVEGVCAVGASVAEADRAAAIQYLLSKTPDELALLCEQTTDAFFAGLTLAQSVETLYRDTELLARELVGAYEAALRDKGFRLINYALTDMSDSAGIIDAIRRETAAEAIAEACRMRGETDFQA